MAGRAVIFQSWRQPMTPSIRSRQWRHLHASVFDVADATAGRPHMGRAHKLWPSISHAGNILLRSQIGLLLILMTHIGHASLGNGVITVLMVAFI